MTAPSSPRYGLAAVNGVELAYQTYGSGAPLVLLHGGFQSAEAFGPTLQALAVGHQVIGVDLQSHGRTPAVDRPMRFESMADDVAALAGHLGHEQVDVLGYSLGGGVALRMAIQHPDAVRRLVVVSTPYRRSDWHPEQVAAFETMGPHLAEAFKQGPLYAAYQQIAPKVEDWPVLVTQLTGLLKEDYDWSAEVPGLSMPVLIVAGDADGLPPRHAVEFFERLGGGQRDAGWDRSGISRHGLAILPRATHYDIAVDPALAAAVLKFLDEEQVVP
jgi:pimeloyl-ACP methyl ester carboxylesterase